MGRVIAEQSLSSDMERLFDAVLVGLESGKFTAEADQSRLELERRVNIFPELVAALRDAGSSLYRLTADWDDGNARAEAVRVERSIRVVLAKIESGAA